MSRSDRLRRWALAALACLNVLGCDRVPVEGPPLTILAGSELKDLEPMQADLEKAAGVPLQFTYSGSLDAVEQLEGGARYDAVWLSHGKYLQLTPSLRPKIRASERIMASPVVLGVKSSRVHALGWDTREPTWNEIAQAAAEGKLTYAMTSPASSNTGFTALVGVASALAGTGDALDSAAIQSDRLAALFQGQKFIAGSSGWLADAFVDRQEQLDGLINYESVILQLNQTGKLREPLVPIYPKEGIVTADYPLMLLNDARRAPYDKLVAYLRSPGMQKRLSTGTMRRPIVPGVAAAAAIPQQVLIELPFPASRDVLDALIEAYQARLRRPASTYFVVDTSGSMTGDGITQLRASLRGLAGDDASLTGRFARFQPRESLYLLPFSDTLSEPLQLQLPSQADALAPALEQIRKFASTLNARGGTAIFSAVQQAYRDAAATRRLQPDRQYGIVVMTDGQNEDGLSEQDFLSWYATLPQADQGIPVFALLFGQANPRQLEQLAQTTGGRVFDARKDLHAAFKQIRGYL